MDDSRFLSGVVEGFYGQPWTQTQRMRLFPRLVDWGLNAYFYAPKDDLKHRALWRECYTDDEMSVVSEIIAQCRQHGVTFIYGISPGLDIRFSDPQDLATLRGRLEQLIRAGAHSFALLFDDLPGKMDEQDKQTFSTVAIAQCSVANHIAAWLDEQDCRERLLFCPTPYCDRMDHWDLGGERYLDDLGEHLDDAIDVLWTGPEIISETIPVESIRKLSQRIGRPPVLWDNLHANDYDMRRLYCGPYDGRTTELKSHLRGVLSNPNCEFPMNYVPLKTLGHYLQSSDYHPRDAYHDAVAQWHAEEYQVVGKPMALEDLLLLTDSYYLPFCQGDRAAALHDVVASLIASPVSSWGDGLEIVRQAREQIERVFETLTRLRDRQLFYAWSRRIWELNEELQLLLDYLGQRHRGADGGRGIVTETHLPGTYRGGMVAQLQRHLVMDSAGRLRPADPN